MYRDWRVMAEDAWCRLLLRLLARVIRQSPRMAYEAMPVLQKFLEGYGGPPRIGILNSRLNETRLLLHQLTTVIDSKVFSDLAHALCRFQERYLHVRPGGDYPLNQLSKADLEDWYTDLDSKLLDLEQHRFTL